MTNPLRDDLGDFLSDDVIEVPVPDAGVRAMVEALGGVYMDGGYTLRLPPPTQPLKPLPLRLGTVDLGNWRIEGMDMTRRRYPGPLYVVKLRREMQR